MLSIFSAPVWFSFLTPPYWFGHHVSCVLMFSLGSAISSASSGISSARVCSRCSCADTFPCTACSGKRRRLFFWA